jgi:hypothetical protein
MAVLTTIQKFVDLLRDPQLLPAFVDVTINERSFVESMLRGSFKYFVLNEFLKVIHANSLIQIGRPPIGGDVRAQIFAIMAKVGRTADPCTCYIPPSDAEDEFEMLLFSDAFPFGREVDSILSDFSNRPRIELRDRLLTLSTQIYSVLEIATDLEASICSIFLFRIVFDRAYAINPKFFTKTRQWNCNRSPIHSK